MTTTSYPIQDTVTHNRYTSSLGEFKHSLTVNGTEGKKVDYFSIARNREYGAVMSSICRLDALPKVFILREFLAYNTVSIQKK